jgi:carnosine N-methyltransferase
VNAVTSHSQRFERFQDNQKENRKVVQDVLENALDYYGVAIEELEWFISTAGGDGEGSVNPNAVSDILNHLVRDWSTGGPHRRDLGSEPILESLSALYPDRKDAGKDPKRVLLPGSGLDRLAHEIAQLGGFEVTSNELSPHMNNVYRYAETLHTPEAQRFHPYIDWWSYQPSMAELAQEIRFPDVAINASDVLHVEGDFLSVFQNSTGEYDAVVTLFFLDTAQNIMDYLETIQRLLKPGGRWINLGTFLYGASPFLHLSLEDLVDIAKKMDFKFLDTDEKWGGLSIPDEKIRTREVCYLFNERAYRKKLFEAQFWIAEKM